VGAALVEEDEGRRVERGGLRAPRRALRLVALGGDQRLFFL
jgi:hypothetical protein